MHELYNVSFPTAWNMWDASAAVYSENMYQLMMHLITHNNIYLSIDRNPSINHGSYTTMKVVEIASDMSDYCMGIPPYILTKANADFDGDIMNIFCHKIGKISEEYYNKSNPRSNMCVSHNDSNYDTETSLFKDGIVGLYAFANC